MGVGLDCLHKCYSVYRNEEVNSGTSSDLSDLFYSVLEEVYVQSPFLKPCSILGVESCL